MKKQVELSITHNGKDVVAYPYTKKEHVQFENGMNIDEFVGQDIATPTITHDTTAIKVGVGDSDVSSSVVDSAVNMTIKGQTYQNILPEPTLRNEMQGKSMQRLNEGYDSIETVDGVSKSAILKGQTMVNGLSNPMIRGGGEYVTILSPTHLLINHGENTSGKKISVNYDWLGGKMRDGADYTLDIWILKNTMRRKDNPTANIGKINFNNYNTGYYSIPTGKTGHIVYEVTTPTTSTVERPYIETFTTCEGELEIQMVIREGKNLIPIEQHFEGMASCKMPVLKTTGKNMFDGELELGTIAASDGYLSETTLRARSSNYIPVFASKTYTLINYDDSVLRAYYEYDKSKQFLRQVLSTGKTSTFTVSSDTKYIKIVIAKPDDTTINSLHQKVGIYLGDDTSLSYEPHKSNILHTSEEVVLKGIGDVQDTLNCNTGEYVERIKEVVFDGSDDEVWGLNANWSSGDYCAFWEENTGDKLSTGYAICDKIPTKDDAELINGGVAIGEGWRYMYQNMYIFIAKSKLPSADINGLKQYLSQNPITVQYELATPTIKTVDLTTSGNWEKVVLDGSETGWSNSYSEWANKVFCLNNSYLPNVIKPTSIYGTYVMCDKLRGYTIQWLCEELGRTGVALHSWGSGYLQIAINGVNTVDELKQYLSQNPVTVWYQTATTLDSTQVKQPIFFKDGHIQLSSGADNSLIPTLDYQAKTKNSYVMDLMKPNTQYTMKAKTVSGTFTIDGTSYNVDANGTFTSPSSMTDKLLIMSNKTNEEVMVLEGNVVDKTIPYFKGIKSAFESEDEIEIVSTGKNLYPYGDIDFTSSYVGWHDAVGTSGMYGDIKSKSKSRFLLPKGTYIFRFKSEVNVLIATLVDDVEKTIGVFDEAFTLVEDTWLTLRVKTAEANMRTFVEEIVISATKTNYEPHKSNTTKIPLLHPLRSLPNGVCDELIIDRLNHKAKLIQRIGYEVLNENTAFSSYPKMEKEKTLLFQTQNANPQGASTYCISDQFIHGNNLWDSSDSDTEAIMIGGGEGIIGKRIDFRISKAKVSTNNVTILQDYLSKEPITVLYQLNIPIITEIDLEGYPYAYKDGHIFLNSDIAPTTQITYSINQAQQIESANESLQRHEKEISHLQKLIAQYIQVEYESTLLSLKI